MRNVKKFLAATMEVTLLGTMLTGCQNNSATKTDAGEEAEGTEATYGGRTKRCNQCT